jgi:predicted CopG family antitoxin
MKRLFPLLALIILVSLGCEKREKKEETTPTKEAPTKQTAQTNTPDRIVARVNGKPIYEKDLGGKPLENIVADEVIYEEGLKRGLDKKLESQIEEYKRGLIVSTLKSEIINSLPKGGEVTDKEIEDYYKENESKFTHMRVKQMTFEDKSLAEEAHKRAMSGEDFEKIASDLSAKSGGNIPVKDLVFGVRYNELFKGKDVGSVSDVIQEGNEFKVIKLVEVIKIPLAKSSESIKYLVLAKRREDAIREFANKVSKEDNIKVEILGR